MKPVRDAGADRDSTEFEKVYEVLRALAARALRSERKAHTLQATALVHEAWIKLANELEIANLDRGQFVGFAARAVRQVLVDHARRRARVRRGGAHRRITLTSDCLAAAPQEVDLLDLDVALKALSELHPRQAAVVEMRFFGGLSGEETAAALGVGARTIDADWHAARAWLARQLGQGTAK